MTKEELQKLAEMRLEDAQVLLERRRPSGAYYLAGYAVECALKACIAKRTEEGNFPHSHDLVKLLDDARLRDMFEERSRHDMEFGSSWGLVKDWSVSSRYAIHDEQVARDMINCSRKVLECLKLNW